MRSTAAEDVIRFPCSGCGKLLGADAAMAIVICAKCQTENPVPAPKAARRAVFEAASTPVRVVGVDVPLSQMIVLGAKVAIASIPLVAVVAAAAAGVVWLAGVLR